MANETRGEGFARAITQLACHFLRYFDELRDRSRCEGFFSNPLQLAFLPQLYGASGGGDQEARVDVPSDGIFSIERGLFTIRFGLLLRGVRTYMGNDSVTLGVEWEEICAS
jgi:hypothetical protein